ncbi:putative ankyrin repeat-containing domain, PGG domain, ankyrin repeat-containing domain superfamily [Helianthus debilis subsp. tardiflorus]
MSNSSTSHAHPFFHIPVRPPSTPPPVPPRPILPSLELLKGSREKYISIGVPLYQAAIRGDWKAAESILKRNGDLIRFAITENEETLLHVAASAKSTKGVEEFVINLVKLMEKKDLELQNRSYDTALNLAAMAGNEKAARIMVEKHPTLMDIPGKRGEMPLYMAALYGKPAMVRYLYGISKKMSGDYWSHESRGWVLQRCVEAGIFDVALKIVNDRPELILKRVLFNKVLLALAETREAFDLMDGSIVSKIKSIFEVLHKKVWRVEDKHYALDFLRVIWGRIARMPTSVIDEILKGPHILEEDTLIKVYPYRVLFHAAKVGNTKFIVELIRLYPDLIWKTVDKRKTIFHLAVKRRHIEIYKLLYEIGAMKDLITPIKDIKDNNMLHMVAKSCKPNRLQDVAGPALQMQRELLWFKEIEQMIPPDYRKKRNRDGMTPQDLFTEKHEVLLKDAKKWMTQTATQCMLVTTLIATIVFTGAFTLPGGYNQNTGIPFFRKEPSFIIYAISDAVSLIASSTSVLIFLSILTSNYAEQDFMVLLPTKLVYGLATLLLSIVTMMVAFSASFFILYNKKLEWVPITITCLAGIPVIIFVAVQFSLFKNVFYSAYRSRVLFKPDKHILY